MEAGGSHTMVWKQGRLHDASRAGELSALCAAVEQAVNAHRSGHTSVRAVILMLEDPAPHAAPARPDPVPVFVDVYDSGFGPDAGYGHGI
jgi:hypothetical protein